MFSAHQYDNYLSTGLNSATEEECVNNVYDYLFAEDDSEEIAETESLMLQYPTFAFKRSRIAGLGVDIQEHDELLPDPYGVEDDHEWEGNGHEI